MLNADGDLDIRNGDFVVGESDDQHVELILASTKGSFLQSPQLGVGLPNFINKQNNSSDDLRRAINVNLQADGYKVLSLTIGTDGMFNLDYEGNYE